MSEKPQEAGAGKQEDLLERIITQGLEKMSAPAQTAAEEEADESETPPTSGPEGVEEALSPPGENTRRSAVYLYLLILFGAAFLMLLLAYFVQQRSSEDAISDLRDSMNLSRAELLNEIRDLEETNATLNGIIAAQRGELSTVYVDIANWREWYEKAALEADDFKISYYAVREELYSWEFFWGLERYYQAGDLETCAALLLLKDRNAYTYSTPEAAQERYGEIVQAVVDAGILDEEYYLHPEEYEDLLNAYYEDGAVEP